jgi:hypothetical protein
MNHWSALQNSWFLWVHSATQSNSIVRLSCSVAWKFGFSVSLRVALPFPRFAQRHLLTCVQLWLITLLGNRGCVTAASFLYVPPALNSAWTRRFHHTSLTSRDKLMHVFRENGFPEVYQILSLDIAIKCVLHVSFTATEWGVGCGRVKSTSVLQWHVTIYTNVFTTTTVALKPSAVSMEWYNVNIYCYSQSDVKK